MKQVSLTHKILAVLFAVPVIMTIAVGADRIMRSLGIGKLNLPESGLWAFFVGACCLATGWVSWQGLSALWKKS